MFIDQKKSKAQALRDTALKPQAQTAVLLF